jgi:AcrR family transcriptional regulator
MVPGTDAPSEITDATRGDWVAALASSRRHMKRDRMVVAAGAFAYRWFLSLFSMVIAMPAAASILSIPHHVAVKLINGVATALPAGAEVASPESFSGAGSGHNRSPKLTRPFATTASGSHGTTSAGLSARIGSWCRRRASTATGAWAWAWAWATGYLPYYVDRRHNRRTVRGVRTDAVHFPSKVALLVGALQRRHAERVSVLDAWVRAAPSGSAEQLLAVFDWLAVWHETEWPKRWAFVNSAAGLADPAHPAREGARRQKRWMRDYLAGVATAARLSRPARSGDLMLDGTNARVLVEGIWLPRGTLTAWRHSSSRKVVARSDWIAGEQVLRHWRSS